MASCRTGSKLIVPVVLSGGTGSRLWPMSRASFPKQLWSLVSERSMLQETVLRGQAAGFAPPVIVCNEEHRFLIAEQLREVLVEDASIMLEPVGRNSAPAITAAALLVAQTHPDAVLWMMAADADIKKSEALTQAMTKAVQAAEAGRVVTFGMTPTRPETGYGYIEKGDPLPGVDGVFGIKSFREKPAQAVAEEFLKDGNYFWNSGMFVFRADVLLDEMRRYAPQVVESVTAAFEKRKTDLDFIRLDKAAFAQAPDISIDYAIAEKPRFPLSSRLIWAGRMLGAGMRCGISAPKQQMATCCWGMF